MESIYAALILHKASKKITDGAIEKILKAAGVEPDSSQISKIVAGLKGKDIDEILSSAAAAPVMAAGSAAAPAAAPAAEKKEEKEEPVEEEPTGIGSLF